MSNGYEEVGLLGEWAFGEWCGLMPRLKPGRGGDGGYDFELPVVLTVDVKTSRKADFLLVEAGKVKADVYVLARYADEGVDGLAGDGLAGEATLVGWAFSTQVKSYEPYDTGRGIINHAVPVDKLRPMAELEKMTGKITRVATNIHP